MFFNWGPRSKSNEEWGQNRDWGYIIYYRIPQEIMMLVLLLKKMKYLFLLNINMLI